ncbi:MAG TPA: hypothetical protein VF764_02510 [Steroidobacteraceae bacterium]
MIASSQAPGSLPQASPDYGNGLVIFADASEHRTHERACFGVICKEFKRRSFVEVPDLVGLHDMPAADLFTI